MNKPITNGRIARWFLLQEFNITIIDRPEKENLVVDFLSRINHGGETSPVEDDFPDEHLFALATKPSWYAHLANYFTTRKLPQHLSPREKQRIIKISANYSWIEGDLFHTRPNLII